MDWNLFIIPLTNIFVQLIKSTKIDKEWLPWLAVLIGGLLGVAYGLAMKADLFVHIVEGLIYGAASAGIYDAGSAGLKKIKAGNEDLD